MNTSAKDRLGMLFGRLPAEPLPDTFRSDLMEKIRAEAVRLRKRRERYALYGVIAASAALLLVAAVTLYLYGAAHGTAGVAAGMPEIPDMPPVGFPNLLVHPVLLFVAGAACLLLAFDYGLRKIFGPYRQKSAPNEL
ncbi:MAG: hypothetical protein LIP00_02890 [Parabacteroides sp.]|nr:hypothetical protein [Parabacteroides sp.]